MVVSAPAQGLGASSLCTPLEIQISWSLLQEPVGANPVQVEVGEFEEPAEDAEEIVAESKSLLSCLTAERHHPLPGWGSFSHPKRWGTSLGKATAQGWCQPG